MGGRGCKGDTGMGFSAGVTRLVGQGASSRKYDLLTALGATGLAGDLSDQKLALRLIVLITARYDWKADRLTTGQREIASLWSVDERTVKREMSRLREKGWLILRRQGARGRVAEYCLGLSQILEDTAPHWAGVGSDLAERLSESAPAATANVVKFPTPNGNQPWDILAAALAAAQPLAYATWIRQLVPEGCIDDEIRLIAPSRFHAAYVETHFSQSLLSLAREVMPQIKSLRVDAI